MIKSVHLSNSDSNLMRGREVTKTNFPHSRKKNSGAHKRHKGKLRERDTREEVESGKSVSQT